MSATPYEITTHTVGIVRLSPSAADLMTGASIIARARLAATTRNLCRPLHRITYTPGDHHVERITRDCLDRGLDPETTALRLLVAADLADVLDGGAP